MRCPSCNKFPSFDIGDPEMDDLEFEMSDGNVRGSVRLVLNTACCGDEAKETTFDIEIDLLEDIEDAFAAAGVTTDWDDIVDSIKGEICDESVEGFDRYETQTPSGKPVPSRYQKHFYGIELTFSVKCTYTPAEGDPVEVSVEHSYKDEVQASSMEEIC